MANGLKGLERRGKSILRGAFRLLPAGPSVPAESIDVRGIRRILVVRLDNRLGNMLLVTPFLERLRACFPSATIDVLVSRAFGDALRGNPDVDGRIVADKAGFIHRPWRFVRFVRDVRGRRYDLAIDLSSSHTFSVSSGVAVRLTGAPLRLGYRRGESDRFLNVPVEPPAGALHEAEIHRNLLRGFAGPPEGPPRLRYTLDDGEAAEGDGILRGLVPAAGPVTGIFLGARGGKAWGEGNFLAVARSLAPEGPVLLMGGPSEASRLEALRGEEGENLKVAPVLPLRRFAALVARCAIFITGDCGPMHLAAALGVPVLAIFLGSDPVRYAPLGEGHRVLHEPRERTPGHVAAVAREMLGSGPRRTPGAGGMGPRASARSDPPGRGAGR